MKKSCKSIVPALLIVAASFPLSQAEAVSAVPTPGEDLQQVAEEDAKPQLENKMEKAESNKASLHFTLKKIHVEQPQSHFSQQRLQDIVDKAVGHEITVNDLEKVLAELTAYGRRHGYPAAFAYVPEQKAKDGVLTIRMVLGKYDEIKLDNQAGKWAEKRARRLMAGLHSGDVVEEKSLETSLFNINDIYGVKASGTLLPGGKADTSNLLITLKPGKKEAVTLYTDNYGSASSGRYRYGIQADFMGIGQSNSRLTVGGMISNANLHNYNLGWEMQAGHSGTRVGIRHSRMDYELGSVLSALGARGVANTTSIYGETPLWTTLRSSLSVLYGVDYRDISNELRMAGINVKKHSYSGHVGVDGLWRSGKGTTVHGVLMGYFGNMKSDSLWGDIMGKASDTLGSYSKGTLDLAVLQQLGHSTDLFFKFSGQLAGHNLDSSEQMYLGGSQGVRAYPSGAGAGDQGALATLELQYHTPWKGLTLRTYLDMGTVLVAKNGNLGSETLKGWGIGITYQHPQHYFARLDYARRIGYEAGTGNEGKSRQRIWFMAGKTW